MCVGNSLYEKHWKRNLFKYLHTWTFNIFLWFKPSNTFNIFSGNHLCMFYKYYQLYCLRFDFVFLFFRYLSFFWIKCFSRIKFYHFNPLPSTKGFCLNYLHDHDHNSQCRYFIIKRLEAFLLVSFVRCRKHIILTISVTLAQSSIDKLGFIIFW